MGYRFAIESSEKNALGIFVFTSKTDIIKNISSSTSQKNYGTVGY